MSGELIAIAAMAAGAGFVHTIIGPDHYLPFIMMAWARKWTKVKTFWVTFLCGVGHVASSIILGLVGIALGIGVNTLTETESTRGDIASWLLIAFGLAYFVWGLKIGFKRKPHIHGHHHLNEDDGEHVHKHTHEGGHIHVHDKGKAVSVTPWALFIIFVFGPCEVLIPFFMYPAAKHSYIGAGVVALVFGAVTIATMLGVVFLGISGISFAKLNKLERFSHAIGGAMILICGLLIMLGL